jgi:DNA-binding transcriptional regulator LsrR (DeoR family)
MAKRRASSKTSVNAARTLARVERAWQLRLQGATQREIARELKVSQPAVSMLLRQGREGALRRIADDAEAARAAEIERAEGQLAALWQEWEAQPVGQRRDSTLREVSRVSERLARLQGLDNIGPQVVVQPTASANPDLSAMSTQQLEMLEALLRASCRR